MTYALDVHTVTKNYGSVRAVDALSMHVDAGTLTCLIGPNGAGKSTTMRMLAGLQQPDAGRIVVAGQDVTADLEARKRLTGMTPQDLAMFDYLTGEESLDLVARLRGVDQADAEQRAARWFTITGLEAARGRLVHTYSGGMKRKLAVAAAMIAEPPLVILDESFTGLDPESTHALRLELRAYCDRGGAVLLSSHILDMVQAIADAVVVVARGTAVARLDSAALDELGHDEQTSLAARYLALTQPNALDDRTL
jgi:ABC-2 type transport system ATP-binding protein